MTLSEISAALQRGEALTAEQEAVMIAALLGGKLVKFYVATGDSGGDELQVVLSGGPFERNYFDPWPTQSVDAALAFVGEVFPGSRLWTEHTLGHQHRARMHVTGYLRGKWHYAPTPSAAIMAAAIKAHLAKEEK